MPTVTISGTDYTVYQDVAAADDYLAADFSATTWRAETDPDQKARALVSGTRLLNRLQWPGLLADPDQLLAWPRTGTGIDSVVDDEIPQPILDASIVLAKLIHAGSQVDTQASTRTDAIRMQKAGSVALEYFFSPDDPSRFPVEIEELVGPYLGRITLTGLASGTCGKTITDRRHSFETGWEG